MTTVFVSTTCLASRDYRDTIAAYDSAGFERVELGYCPDPVDVQSVVETSPFEFVAHNYCFPPEDPFVLNLASPDPVIRRRSIEYVEEAVAFCDANGIDQYTFHAGFRSDPDLSLTFPDTFSQSYVTAFNHFCESLSQILDTVGGTEVRLGVENNVVAPENVVDGEPVTLLCRPDEIEQMYDHLGTDSDQLGLLLDTGHLSVSAETLDFEPEQFVEAALSRTVGLHLHTNDGASDQHRPVSPGSEVLETCRRFSDVPVTTEATFEDVDRLVRHVSMLESVFSPPAH